MVQVNSDIRTLLLEALGLGEWEAEHLAGVDLARQVVELLAWYRRELHATMVRLQRLAIDAQELQSGEAWDQLRQQMAEIEAENRRLRELVLGVGDQLRVFLRNPYGPPTVGEWRRMAERLLGQLPAKATASTGGPSPMVLDGED